MRASAARRLLRRYGPGDVMAREGEAEDSLFILLQGSALKVRHSKPCVSTQMVQSMWFLCNYVPGAGLTV